MRAELDDRIVHLWSLGYDNKKISEKIQKSHHSVGLRVRQLGLIPNRYGINNLRFFRYYIEGKPYKKIAKILGVKKDTLYYYRKRLGLISRDILSEERKKVCDSCHKEFYATRKYQKVCEHCYSRSEIGVFRYKLVSGIRYDYQQLLNSSPQEARRIKEEMIKKEGEKFVRMALGKLFDKKP